MKRSGEVLEALGVLLLALMFVVGVVAVVVAMVFAVLDGRAYILLLLIGVVPVGLFALGGYLKRRAVKREVVNGGR